MSTSPTPTDFALAKDSELEDGAAKFQAENTDAEQISAADYDPSLDRREDEQRRIRDPALDVQTIEEEVEELEEEDDVDDMFAVATNDTKKAKKVKKKAIVCLSFHVKAYLL